MPAPGRTLFAARWLLASLLLLSPCGRTQVEHLEATGEPTMSRSTVPLLLGADVDRALQPFSCKVGAVSEKGADVCFSDDLRH